MDKTRLLSPEGQEAFNDYVCMAEITPMVMLYKTLSAVFRKGVHQSQSISKVEQIEEMKSMLVTTYMLRIGSNIEEDAKTLFFRYTNDHVTHREMLTGLSKPDLHFWLLVCGDTSRKLEPVFYLTMTYQFNNNFINQIHHELMMRIT